jgi:hypothetical protein
MARIPILQDPQQIRTGNQTVQTPNLPAVTNASIGKAVGDVGNVIFDISEKAKRANDVTKLTEASLAMNKAQMDFATWQQSPDGQDEKQWLPKWKELTANLETQFNAEELTPDARLQLSERLSSWGTRGTINVQANAFKQAGARMDATGELAKREAIRTGNLEPVKQFQKNRAAAGLSQGPEFDAVEYAQVEDAAKANKLQDLRSQEAELMRLGNQGDMNAWQELKANYDQQRDLGGLVGKNYERAQKQTERGEIESLVKARIHGSDGLPVDLTRAKKIIDGSDLTPQTKLELENEIVSARNRYANQDLISFANRMAKGEAIDGEDFNSQYMGEAELAETRAKINEAVPVTPDQEARFYLDTMTAIDEFDPEKAKERDPAEVVKMAKAALGIRKSPPHLRNLLAETMQAKLSGSAAKTIVAQGEAKARDMLLEIVKGQEAEYFQGDGADKKLNPAKAGEWMKFQQKIFNLQADIYERIKDVKDTGTIDKIVQDALQADYVKVKKQQRYTPSGSGFSKEVPATEFDGAYRIPMPKEGPFVPMKNPFLPSFDAFQP